MEKKTINEPKQQRSIDKKNRILAAGYELITEKGYYHTNTAEIAKRAGVSSGIVYRYFVDKKDILIQALKLLVEPRFVTLYKQLDALETMDDIDIFFPNIIAEFLEIHRFNPDAFRETTAMMLLDDEVRDYMHSVESACCLKIEEAMLRLGFPKKHIKEKVFMIFQMANHLCDDSVEADADVDYDYVIKKTLNMITGLIADEN